MRAVHRRPAVAFLLCSWLALGCAATSSRRAAATDPGVQARARLSEMVSAREVVGASYLVVSAAGVEFEAHVGRRDAARTGRVDGATMYMACSITKALTAIVVMRLVELGRMRLDAPLTDYYRDHPYGDGVTIGGLLAHTSGVPNPMPLDWYFVEGERLDREGALRRVLADAPELDAEPGAEYAYSNVGYWLLEKAIEGATGMPFERVVQDHLFAPLSLEKDDASFELPPPERLATGHSRKWSVSNALFYLVAPSRYWARAHAGFSRFARLQAIGLGYGGLYTSARALAAVLRDLVSPQPTLLSEASRAAMFAPQRAGGERQDVALGWVSGTLDGVEYRGKQGGGLGYHGNVRVYPSIGLATVYLANTTEVTPGPIDARSDALDAAFIRHRSARGGRPRH